MDDLKARFPFFNVAHVGYVWNIIEQICQSPITEVNACSSSDLDSSAGNTSEGELSLGDIESDDSQRQQELICSQYRKVTLQVSSESSDED